MFQSLINLFYPKVCAGCDSFLLSTEYIICSRCRNDMPLTHHSKIAENEAFKKFYGKVPVEFAATFVYFHKKGLVQRMIHNLKYKGCEEVGTAMGEWFALELKTIGVLLSVDAIIPVPLHKRKLRARGYNQVTTFGLALSEKLEITYNDNLLVRTRYSKTQTTKNLLGRTEVNANTIFDVVFTQNDYNKHFLLIDDVLTTGSTLEACSRALLKIPGTKISIICLAMTN